MLQNLNKLNRSLEGVIAVITLVLVDLIKQTDVFEQVGNEFSQVEGLWSQFENVMAKETDKDENKDTKDNATAETS